MRKFQQQAYRIRSCPLDNISDLDLNTERSILCAALLKCADISNVVSKRDEGIA